MKELKDEKKLEIIDNFIFNLFHYLLINLHSQFMTTFIFKA